jgi:hypothetical protein
VAEALCTAFKFSSENVSELPAVSVVKVGSSVTVELALGLSNFRTGLRLIVTFCVACPPWPSSSVKVKASVAGVEPAASIVS